MAASGTRSFASTLRKVAPLLGGMLFGGLVGGLTAPRVVPAVERLALSGGETAALVALGVLLLPLLVLWHELGHVAGGRMVGFRPVLLVVGPARWQREGGRWRLSANRTAALAGGLAVCVPEHTHDLTRRTAGMIAGGPLASLLGAVLGVSVWAALPPLGPESPFAVVAGYTVVAVFGFGNLLLAAVSLFPSRAGGFYSDGARLLRMLRGGPEMDREVAILLLTGATIGGTRPREWDPELVRRAVGEADGSLFHVGGLQMAFAHAQDRGDLDAARAHVAALLAAEEAFPPLLRPALRLNLVYFAAVHDGDAARARALVESGQGGLLIDRHIRHVAQAAAAWASGKAERAAAELDLADAALARAMDRGAGAAAADRVAELRRLVREAPGGVADLSLAAPAGPG